MHTIAVFCCPSAIRTSQPILESSALINRGNKFHHPAKEITCYKRADADIVYYLMEDYVKRVFQKTPTPNNEAISYALKKTKTILIFSDDVTETEQLLEEITSLCKSIFVILAASTQQDTTLISLEPRINTIITVKGNNDTEFWQALEAELDKHHPDPMHEYDKKSITCSII